MPTFIDESGDTGCISAGGSKYFRVAAVWVPDETIAEEFRMAIRRLRSDLNLKGNYEFKFAKTLQNPDRRRAFFDIAMNHEFRFAVSHIDKSQPEWIGAETYRHHRICAMELAALMRPIYSQAAAAKGGKLKDRVVVDDNRDGVFLETIKRELRELNDPNSWIGKVTFRDCGGDEMMQLVDMVCGATGEYISEGNEQWYRLIADRDVESRFGP